MGKNRFHLHARLMLFLLAGSFTVLLWALFDLQIVNGSYYLAQSTRKIANTETVQAARGEILDRYGRVLVSNRATYQVTLNPNMMGTVQDRNDTILSLLEVCREQGVEWADTLPVSWEPPFCYTTEDPFQIVTLDDEGREKRRDTQLGQLTASLKLKEVSAEASAGELISALRTWFEVDPAIGGSEGRALVGILYELTLRSRDISRSNYVFAQDVDIFFITVVKEKRLSGVTINTATVREYNTKYAAHLLGQVGPIFREEWENYQSRGYSMDDIVGKDGVEQAFEEYLRGSSGVKDVEYNQSGKIVSESWRADPATGLLQIPSAGDNVMLTLDIKLQEVVEESLRRHVPGMTEESQKAACVVVDMSGGVLAAASFPSYDPAEYYSN